MTAAPELPLPGARPVAQLPPPGALPGGCLYLPTWSGLRVLAHVTAGGVRLRTRAGDDVTLAFPEAVAGVARRLPVGTVLDGELVAAGGRAGDTALLFRRAGSARRGAPLAATAPAVLVASDLLAVEGHDVRSLPLRERWALLESVLSDQPDRPDQPVGAASAVRRAPATRNASVAAAWLRRPGNGPGPVPGVQGLLVKGRGEPYRPGRVGWAVYRPAAGVLAVVGAVVGPIDQPLRLVLSLPGPLVLAGSTLPLEPGQARDLAPLLRAAVPGEHPWVVAPPTTLVRPGLVVEVATAPVRDRWSRPVQYLRARPDLDLTDVRPRSRVGAGVAGVTAI